MTSSFVDNQVENNLHRDQIHLLKEKLSEVQMHLRTLANGPRDNDELNSVVQSLLEFTQILEKYEAKYNRLIQRMWALVFEIDPAGNMLVANDVVARITGYLPDELMGRAWIELLFPGEFGLQVEELLERSKVGDVTGFEISLVSKDHKVVRLELNSANEYDQDNNLVKIVCLCLDMTERKNAEDRLRKSQRELIQAQKIAHLGSWIWDIPSNTVTWSEELYRIYGLTAEEGRQTYEDYILRVHPEDREKVDKAITSAYRDIKAFNFEERILRPDGEVRILNSRGEVICGKDGPVRMIGICHDVTEQKLAQQALRERDELLRRAVTHSPVILFMLDLDGVIQVSIGKSLAQHRGVDSSVGKSIYEVYGDVPQAIQNFERARGGESFSDLIEASGLAFEAHYEPYVDEEGQVKGVVGVAFDVTSRLQSERALRASEERYRLLLESVKEYAIFTLDLDGYVTSWNRGARNIKGYAAGEIIGQHFSIFYPSEDISRGKPDTALEHARLYGQFEDEGWRVRKDGSRLWANVVLRALHDDSGELYGFSKVTRDMTKRREAEEKLRQSEARFRSIFYGVDVGIELVDLDGQILEFNPSLCEIFGYTYAELRELTGKQVNNHANIVANLPVFGELQRGERDYYHAERPFLHRDNHLIWGRLSISLVRDSDDKPQFIIGMIENISQRKQMENELAELNRRLMEGREAERLHLAQELHDGPVQDLYSLSYTLAAFKTGLPPNADLELVEKMGSSVQKVVKTLKGISGELRPPALAPYGLEKAIRSYVEEFQTTNSDLKVHLDLKPDGQQLPEQVRLVLYRIFQSSFTNIIRHADANAVALRFIFDDDAALLEIEDDGKGFSIPNRWIELAREGHLGIVGAIERVEAIGGTLNVNSAPGKGTQILVKIPLKEELPAQPN